MSSLASPCTLTAQILSRLARRSYQTTAELAVALGCDRTILVTRLNALRRQGVVDRRCDLSRAWVWWVSELEMDARCDLEAIRVQLERGQALSVEDARRLVRECGRLRGEVVSSRVEVALMKVRS